MNKRKTKIFLGINVPEVIKELENIQDNRLQKLSRVFGLPSLYKDSESLSEIRKKSNIEDYPKIKQSLKRIKKKFNSDYEFFATYLLYWKIPKKYTDLYSDVIDNFARNIIVYDKCLNKFNDSKIQLLLPKFEIFIEHYFVYTEISFLILYTTNSPIYEEIVKYELDLHIFEWIFMIEKLNHDLLLETVLEKMDKFKLLIGSHSRYSLIKNSSPDHYLVDVDTEFWDLWEQLTMTLSYFWKEIMQDFRYVKQVEKTNSLKPFKLLWENGFHNELAEKTKQKFDIHSKKKTIANRESIKEIIKLKEKSRKSTTAIFHTFKYNNKGSYKTWQEFFTMNAELISKIYNDPSIIGKPVIAFKSLEVSDVDKLFDKIEKKY